MKKRLILLSALVWVALTLSFAQKEIIELKVKYGKISDEEIKMTSYAKDPNAPAVVLFDKGYLSLGNFSSFERHIRIKIFKKEALDQANFRIIFSKANEQFINNLKATCYNIENGKLVETKALSDNIFEEALDKTMSVKKINIPGVREGSIIEIKYIVSNPGVPDWNFQSSIPTIWSEYETQIPEYYVISQIGKGAISYTAIENDSKSETLTGTDLTYQLNIKRWVAKDVPAIKPEYMMSSIEDYRGSLSFFLEEIRPPRGLIHRILPTWKEAAKKLMEDVDFGDFIEKKSAMKEELATAINEKMTPIEKVQAIYDYIGKTYETNTYDSKYVLTSLKEMKTKKKISVSEKNFLFMNMLHNAGISVSPVIIRTRDEGHVNTSLAVLGRYNRTICHVKLDKDTFFVDASGYPQPFKMLPFNDLSEVGVAFSGKENYEFIPVTSKVSNKVFNQFNLTLNTEGVLSGDVNITFRGYDGYKSKKFIKDESIDKFLKTTFKEVLVDGKIESHKFENAENLSDEVLKGIVKFSTPAFVNKTDDKMYINPMLYLGEKENPFKSEERLFNVDYGVTKEDIVQIFIKLPEGYKVEELPKSTRFQTTEGSIKYELLVGEKEGVITINTKFQIKKVTFQPEQYGEVRGLYAQMIAKMGEQIVLSKATK